MAVSRKSTKAAAPAAEVKKETAKTPESKAVKAEVKAAPETETKTAVKKTAVKKETVAEVKKAPVKKEAVKAEPATSVFFEYDGYQIVAKDLLAKAMEAFQAAHKHVEMKEVQLYVNGNEGFAYIVVNGVEYPEDKIAL